MDSEPELERMMLYERSWGYEDVWAETERYTGKLLHLSLGQSMTLDGEFADRSIYVLRGRVQTQASGSAERAEIGPGTSLQIAPGVKQQLCAVVDCDLVELAVRI